MPRYALSSLLLSLALVTHASIAGGLDEDGWTIFEAVDGQRIVYVSKDGSSQGEVYIWDESEPPEDIGPDPFNPTGEVDAFESIATAYAELNSGQPGWMLLRRGDDWLDETPTHLTVKSGPSSGPGWMLIGAYTPDEEWEAMDRPAIKMLHYFSSTESLHRVAFLSLDVRREDGSGPNDGAIFLVPLHARDLHIEDVLVPAGRCTGISIHGSNPSSSVIENVHVRRSIVYGRRPHCQGDRAQGIYIEHVDGLHIEESVFWHNGRIPELCPWPRHCPDEVDLKNDRSQNVYINCNNANVTFIGNITAEAATAGIQQRPGGWNEDNLYLRSPINLFYGPSGCTIPEVTFASGFVNGVERGILRNVVIDSRDIDHKDPDKQRADGIWVQRATDTPVKGNLVMNRIGGQMGGGIRLADTLDNVLVEENIVFNWAQPNENVQSFLALCPGGTHTQNDVVIANNHFQAGGRLVNHWPGFDVFTYSSNVYHSTGQCWFRVASNCSGPTCKTLSEWVNLSGETNAVAEEVQYRDPTRDIASYLMQLHNNHPDFEFEDFNPNQDDAITYFMLQAIQQSKTNWRPEVTAYLVNDWIRGGFFDIPVSCIADLTGSTNEPDGIVNGFDLLFLLGA